MLYDDILMLDRVELVLAPVPSTVHEMVPYGASSVCYSCGRVTLQGTVRIVGDCGAVHLTKRMRQVK